MYPKTVVLRYASWTGLAAVLMAAASCSFLDAAAQRMARQKSGAAVESPKEDKDTHKDGPIIIDNPNAFLSLLPDRHEPYLAGPIPLKVDAGQPAKTVTYVFDKVAYTHIELSGTENKDNTYALSDKAVKVVLNNAETGGNPVSAGTIEINWAKVGAFDAVTIVSTDNSASDDQKKLRWKQDRKPTDKKDRLGLYAADDREHDYRVASVTFDGQTAVADTSKKKVRVQLCSKLSGGKCAKLE